MNRYNTLIPAVSPENDFFFLFDEITYSCYVSCILHETLKVNKIFLIFKCKGFLVRLGYQK